MLGAKWSFVVFVKVEICAQFLFEPIAARCQIASYLNELQLYKTNNTDLLKHS